MALVSAEHTRSAMSVHADTSTSPAAQGEHAVQEEEPGAAEKEAGGQGEQPEVSMKLPEGQTHAELELLPSSEVAPGGQAEHSCEPGLVLYLPTSHLEQLPLPV